MRSSILSGLVVTDSPAPSSIKRHQRSGAAGSKALQWGLGRVASARLKVGLLLRGSPLASTQAAANAESSSTPAHTSKISRSNGQSENTMQRLSTALASGR